MAVKRVNASDEEAAADMAREIGFWSRLCEPLSGGGCHPHIVPLLGNGPRDKAGFVHLVMDYCAGGHLWQEVERRQRQAGGAAGGAVFSEKEAAGVVADVSAALAHMHGLSPPLSHRDIKLENILLADGGAWRLCDFGSCSERCEASSELCFPWLYVPPTTYYRLPSTHYLLPTTYYLLPTTYYLLPTTYYLLLTTLYSSLQDDDGIDTSASDSDDENDDDVNDGSSVNVPPPASESR